MKLSMAAIQQFRRQNELSTTQINALYYLLASPQASINSVANHFGFTKAAASQTIDRLVERGLVNRQVDPADRRGKRLCLTEMGKEKVAQASQARRAWLHTLIDAFTPEQQANLQPAFRLLLEGMNKVFTQTNAS
ncbi:MAG TPA: MarR family transcriptional regulator [Anaerolineaceae bacterium]|nr:MarR family transcriptional regulator [Anaerolineaceae bacterium]